MDEEQNKTGEQSNNRPWLYKKGQSGNPSGRPPGISLKEYAKKKFLTMTDEEREAFFNGMDKKTLWEMGEGKAHQAIDHTTAGKELPVPIINIHGVLSDNSNEESDADEPSDTSDTGWDISK